MNYLISALVFLVAASASAQVQFDAAQQIQMTGKSCQELEAHALSIMEWTKNLTNTTFEMPQCFCSKKSCQMDVAKISPYFVKEHTLYGTGFQPSSAHDGPNCFNAALVVTNTLSKITYTHPFEMTAILDSPLCTERARDEELVPGDVLVVRNQADPLLEIHAGIYLNARLSFSKYGQQSLMPYSYGMDVDKSYGVKNAKCRRVVGLPSKGDECYGEPFASFYSCTPMYSFVSQILNQPLGLDKRVQKIYAGVSSIEYTVSDVAYAGGRLDVTKLGQLQTELMALNELAKEIDVSTVEDNNYQLLRLMKFRMFSIYEQTRILALSLKSKTHAQPGIKPPQE